MDTLIRVDDLRFHYDDGTAALRGINFHLEAGERVVLFGGNGSGKTTFALHLNGLLRGEGRIEICGLRLEDANLAAIRSKIGMVFQDPEDQLFMPTVLEDVCFGVINQGRAEEEARQIALAALEQVGMKAAAGKAPYHLSSGEKRRVALAGVLAMGPEILVLDEPTTFLDPPGQRQLVEVLRELPQACILVTHNLNFARRLGTRAVFFAQGQVAGEGTVDEIVSRFAWEW